MGITVFDHYFINPSKNLTIDLFQKILRDTFDFVCSHYSLVTPFGFSLTSFGHYSLTT